MISMPRVGGVGRAAVVIAALLVLRPAPPAANLRPVGIVITDTSMSMNPSSGSRSTSFVATLTYTPRSEVCPPTATSVSFTWDGYDMGTGKMQGSASPCHATLSTKPLAGYTAAGTHQICGTFQYQGAHNGCAPFRIAASNHSPSSPIPSSSSSKGQGGSTSTAVPRTRTSSEPVTARTSSVVSPSSTPDVRPVAAPAAKTHDEAGNGPLIGVAVGGLALLVALWLPLRKRLRRSS
jgi:hypothetical protein